MGPQLASRCLFAVVGPTASGKTALALRLAERLGGEVLNADSRQVYRWMDIGTAKPTAEERARVRHWLVDIAEPHETFSLGRYLDLAGQTLSDCWSRGVLPILAGGTGQYVWALLEGWQVPRVPPDHTLRAELKAQLGREGPEPLLEELRKVDSEYAASVDPRNVRRVIRALEVYRHTGRPISATQTRQPPDMAWAVVGLTCQRNELYRRIDARVDAMMAAGFLDEVRALLDRGYGGDPPAMSGIGYRQLRQHLAGDLSLDDAVARIKTQTHRLARLQHAWFQPDDARIHWIDVTASDPFANALLVVESKLIASGGQQG
jgi:tRNA dimethylallyltransferase